MNRLSLFGFIILALVGLQGCGASQSAVSVPETASSEASNVVQTESDERTVESEVISEDVHDSEVPAPVESVSADDGDRVINIETVPKSAEEEAVPADFFRCEVKISMSSSVYTAASVGPTLEEARDTAVDEACAIPCAESIAGRSLSEDEAETAIDACTNQCTDNADVLAASCWQNDKTVYTEGEWSETGDAAPTNGAEILDVQQVQ